MQPSNDPIRAQIRYYLARNILFTQQDYPYADSASLLEEGIIDSMNVMELVSFLEEKFGLTVEDVEILPDNFDSVARMADFVQRKLNDQKVQE